jgi:hypothetical protein
LSGSSSCRVYAEALHPAHYPGEINILYDLLEIAISMKVDVLTVPKDKLDMANN